MQDLIFLLVLAGIIGAAVRYLYKQKKTLEFKINVILDEMGLIKREDDKYEELILDYNKFNQELYDVEIEIVTRGGVLC